MRKLVLRSMFCRTDETVMELLLSGEEGATTLATRLCLNLSASCETKKKNRDAKKVVSHCLDIYGNVRNR